MDDAVLHPLKAGVRVSSPGMKYKHYSPKANVVILDGTDAQYRAYVNAHAAPHVMALCYDGDADGLQVPALCYGNLSDERTLAHDLFDALREVDGARGRDGLCALPEPRRRGPRRL